MLISWVASMVILPALSKSLKSSKPKSGKLSVVIVESLIVTVWGVCEKPLPMEMLPKLPWLVKKLFSMLISWVASMVIVPAFSNSSKISKKPSVVIEEPLIVTLWGSGESSKPEESLPMEILPELPWLVKELLSMSISWVASMVIVPAFSKSKKLSVVIKEPLIVTLWGVCEKLSPIEMLPKLPWLVKKVFSILISWEASMVINPARPKFKLSVSTIELLMVTVWGRRLLPIKMRPKSPLPLMLLPLVIVISLASR